MSSSSSISSSGSSIISALTMDSDFYKNPCETGLFCNILSVGNDCDLACLSTVREEDNFPAENPVAIAWQTVIEHLTARQKAEFNQIQVEISPSEEKLIFRFLLMAPVAKDFPLYIYELFNESYAVLQKSQGDAQPEQLRLCYAADYSVEGLQLSISDSASVSQLASVFSAARNCFNQADHQGKIFFSLIMVKLNRLLTTQPTEITDDNASAAAGSEESGLFEDYDDLLTPGQLMLNELLSAR